MTPRFYAKKQRQLRRLVKRFNALLQQQQANAIRELEALKRKIKALVRELSLVLSPFQLKKILGSAAVLLGISSLTPANAQMFGPAQQNPFGLTSLSSYLAFPTFADLDKDGDLDLVVGEYNGKIDYFKNTGTATSPQFAAHQTNPFGLSTAIGFAIPTLADLDNDGDLDLLVGEYYANFKYYQNIGTPTNPQFTAPLTNPFGLTQVYYIGSPTFVDLDKDGDLDLFVGEYYGNFQYFENTGSASNPQFAAPQKNPFGLTGINGYIGFPVFADLDKDGDLDLLVGEYYGNMEYFENTGTANNPQFAASLTNPFGLTQTDYFAIPAFADLDKDGDMDLLVGEYYATFKYFENISSVGTQEKMLNADILLSPNPANDFLDIKTDTRFKTIQAFDAQGKLIQTFNDNPSRINIEQWSSGYYLLKFIDSDGYFASRKVVKE
ncbi:MAG: FG-GAP-like repeat-containing protein [Saprospiraceae bacterium]